MKFFSHLARPSVNTLARQRPLITAFILSLGAAISLGLARFSYALLLPPMREDLEWSYLIAGSMNTGNALGYLIGALLCPAILQKFGAQRTLLGGAGLTSLLLLWGGWLVDADFLLLQRVLSGIGSALIFIAGGLLAARLGSLHPQRAGLLIGMYYGGTGIGIATSSLLIPATLTWTNNAGIAHGWQWAWIALGLSALIATLALAKVAGLIDGAPAAADSAPRPRMALLGFGLASYFMFGVGYIGYMTFVVALLKTQGMSGPSIGLFYLLLGLSVMASSRIWAGMLDHFKGGQSIAILSTLLGLATLIPVLTSALPLVLLSGIIFGGSFLSCVAATTALVRHNLPPASWSAGISMFTIAFAFGQICGPSFVGWIADGAGGLERGLIYSACALFLGAIIASRQKALAR